MTDFSNISALEVTQETVKEYTFDMIRGDPSIFFSPAHDSNPDFLTERLRLNIERSAKIVPLPRGKKPPPQTPDDLKKDIEVDRETDRVLISRCCARRWGNAPVDANGNTPEFTEESCYAFFKAMPIWMFDPLRNWVQNIYNFVDRPIVSDEEAAALGNS